MKPRPIARKTKTHLPETADPLFVEADGLHVDASDDNGLVAATVVMDDDKVIMGEPAPADDCVTVNKPTQIVEPSNDVRKDADEDRILCSLLL